MSLYLFSGVKYLQKYYFNICIKMEEVHHFWKFVMSQFVWFGLRKMCRQLIWRLIIICNCRISLSWCLVVVDSNSVLQLLAEIYVQKYLQWYMCWAIYTQEEAISFTNKCRTFYDKAFWTIICYKYCTYIRLSFSDIQKYICIIKKFL